MKKNIIITIILVVLICQGCLIGCSPSGKKVDSSSQKEDSVVNQSSDMEEETVQTQAEINEAAIDESSDYNESVEKEYQKLLLALPQYKNELGKETSLWQQYQDAVLKVAGYGDHGSSTPMFVADMTNQGEQLREVAFHNLMLHLNGKAISKSKTTFSGKMIAEAYTAFVEAISEDEFMEQKDECIKALRKEQECWNRWMNYRGEVSKKLPKDIKEVYDECTNLTMRLKLLQLKNQNQGLGMVSDETLHCLLPDDCSDKALLEYPGFNVVWKNN
jgi:hypothetical protein